MDTKKVAEFARLAHKGLTRWDGKTPVFEGHIALVADAVDHYVKVTCVSDPQVYVAAAYLHDVLEDTDKTSLDILNVLCGAGFDSKRAQRTVDAVELMTHKTGTYTQYVMRMANMRSPAAAVARLVKTADLVHNLSGFIEDLPKGRQRVEKYLLTLHHFGTQHFSMIPEKVRLLM